MGDAYLARVVTHCCNWFYGHDNFKGISYFFTKIKNIVILKHSWSSDEFHRVLKLHHDFTINLTFSFLTRKLLCRIDGLE